MTTAHREHPRQPRRLLALALSVALCASVALSVCSAASVPPPRRTIRVGSFPYSGQLSVDSDGKYSGYGFDYLQEIARHVPWQFEFVEATWDESLAMLERGEIDLMGTVIKSEAREAIFDFADWPMVSGYGVLATPLDNKTLAYEDFARFDGLRVGALKANQQGPNFLKYGTEHDFAPQMFYYATQTELEAALSIGALDGILMTSTLRSSELRVVAKFGENDSYFATTKGNTRLLGELNEAMRKIRVNNPYFNSDLSQKYVNIQEVTPISFTREELAFIQGHGPLRCVYDPAARPISYRDKQTGEARGIVPDICALLAEKTGFTFEMVGTDTLAEAEALFARGEAELLLAQSHDLNSPQSGGARLTDAYLEGQMVMVTAAEPKGAVVVAVCDAHAPEQLLTELFDDRAEMIYLSDVDACLDAVRTGRADAAFVNSIVMSYQAGNPKYTHLIVTPMYGYPASTHIAVTGDDSGMLTAILDKTLKNLSPTQMNHIVSSNLRPPQFNALLGALYTYPVQSVVLVAVVPLLLSLCLFLLLRGRAKNARATEKALYTDTLTGRPNYKALLKEAPAIIERRPETHALVYMDMHQFKAVNDTFGYDAGDRLLCNLSDLLCGFVAEDERFARVYADKFVLLLRYTADGDLTHRLNALSQRLEALSAGEFEGAKFLFSGGVYRLRRDSCELELAFDRANYARDTVKEHFVNTFVLYDDVMRRQVMKEKDLESRMLSALEKGEFVPFYQPKVNVVTGTVVGAEALVRWKDPVRGYVEPGEFLPFYERNGFIVKIDFMMFEAVCRQLRWWLDEGRPVVPVSVNFSRRHMRDKQFLEKLKALVDRYDISPDLLEIEITETVALESTEIALAFAKGLKDHGFMLSIDDYGTGYSSISLLQDLPLDVLKLDKTFLESAMCSQKAQDLMSNLITAVKKNGIRVLCEGVETQEQRDFMAGLNCRFAQGFLYAKPLPREEYEAYLDNHPIGALDCLDYLAGDDLALVP